jgi:hypothetical protein
LSGCIDFPVGVDRSRKRSRIFGRLTVEALFAEFWPRRQASPGHGMRFIFTVSVGWTLNCESLIGLLAAFCAANSISVAAGEPAQTLSP